VITIGLTGVPYPIAVPVGLARICRSGTIVHTVVQAVAIIIGVAHVTDTVAVEVLLPWIRNVRTVVSRNVYRAVRHAVPVPVRANVQDTIMVLASFT